MSKQKRRSIRARIRYIITASTRKRLPATPPAIRYLDRINEIYKQQLKRERKQNIAKVKKAVTNVAKSALKKTYKAARVGYRKSKIAAQKGFSSTKKAWNNLRRDANFGEIHPDDRNKILPGFKMSANQYDQERLKDRAKMLQRKKFQDSQSGLGIQSHPYYSKSELAGGAVVANAHHNQNALNAAAAARRGRKLQLRSKAQRKAAGKQIRDNAYWRGLENMGVVLTEMQNIKLSKCIDAATIVYEKALKQNTPMKTGNLARSIKREVKETSGQVYYDPKSAYYAPYVNDGTKFVGGKHMMEKSLKQTAREIRAVGVKAYKI